MLIFDIIKKIIINIITPPEAGNNRKLVKSSNELLKEPLIESNELELNKLESKETNIMKL
jgi:hypothetical protein